MFLYRIVRNSKRFKNSFPKLITLYDARVDNVIQFYRQFIPDFGKTTDASLPVRSRRSKTKLRDIAPEVFITGYPPLCSNQPVIVSDEEAEQAKRQGLQVMVFPKPGTSIEQRNYVCNYDVEKYPGLRNNPLSNKNVLPFLPCCYGKTNVIRKTANTDNISSTKKEPESSPNRREL